MMPERQRAGAALQIEQDDRLDSLELLEPCPHGGVVDEKNLRHLLKPHALVEEEHRVRPAGDAMLLQLVPGDLHQVGPIRRTEEIAARLHQTTGIDPADSVKRFSEERGIPLISVKAYVVQCPTVVCLSPRTAGVKTVDRRVR